MRGAGRKNDGFDVVVVGAGLAGTVAALRARELGARTLLLDRGENPAETGNTRLSGGTLHAALRSMRAEPTEIEARIAEVTDGTARPDVAHTYAHSCGRAVGWLEQRGIALTFRASGDLVFAPPRSFEDVHAWRGVGAHRGLVDLQAQYAREGGELWAGTAATGLRTEPSRGGVGGVVVETSGETHDVDARNVILADGGFQADPLMLRTHIGPFADRIKLRGSPASKGDAIRLAASFGAQLVNMPFFYGHCLHRGALDDDRLWPMPILDAAVERGMVVDTAGFRVVDEGLGGIAVANAIARLDDPRGTWVVLDGGAWASLERSRIAHQPHVTDIESRGGVVYTETSIEELARSSGIGAVLVETVHAFNDAVEQGNWLAVVRSGAPRRIVTAPFRAIPLVPGITFTMGGLAIDGNARVLGVDDAPIRGLFAAGGSAAGLQGTPRGGYVGGLSAALVFGLVAGETAAR